MFPWRVVVLASVTLISLIAIAWISYDSARVMAETVNSLDQADAVLRTASARRFAIYGPWAMCAIAAIMLGSMLVRVRSMQVRARESRAELQRAVRLEHAARQGAEEADHKKDQFLATVSHELRTPLTSIIGWCGLLSDEKARQTLLEEGLASIAQAARVQSQLVEDLLDVSRIIAGKLEPHLADVNAVDVIENAIASVAPSARAKCITIGKLVEGQPRTLRADATRLEQVAWNLLSNAIKFTPQHGSIRVSLRWTEWSLQITVTDNGEGIEPELLPHIFDPFRQGLVSGTRKAGLGLGLSIVKSLVELHGGAVRAESGGTGAGATFIVELPLAGVESSKGASRAIGRLFIARRPSLSDDQRTRQPSIAAAHTSDGVVKAS
jgi:signal transduction histidine kinase